MNYNERNISACAIAVFVLTSSSLYFVTIVYCWEAMQHIVGCDLNGNICSIDNDNQDVFFNIIAMAIGMIKRKLRMR
jgi:hypothetical protein